MSKPYDSILFDLDGTLTDPFIGITKSIQYSLRNFGINEENLENLKRFIGPPLKDSFKEFYLFDEEKAIKAIEKYREYFSVTGIFENKLYPGIPQLLKDLNKRGKKLIVATSKPTVFAEKILAHFDLYKYFYYISGSNLDGSRVKKGEVISFALQESGIKPSNNVVMIGDRKHDIIGAKEVGIDSIGVLYGFGPRQELEVVYPTYIVESVEDLIKLL